ncbi:MAG: FkbM family methyltransferase [Candidatus Paceibacterota bacterium]|jgi:FkbM family methyltransferase
MSKIQTFFNAVKTFKNWPLFFLDYLGLVKGDHLIYEMKSGAKYDTRIGKGDRGIISEIWGYKIYTPKGFEIKENDLVVDIGAQIGVFSIFAAQYAKKGRIYSFEPVPENFRMLEKNKELNHIGNILPLNLAVADKKGERDIYLASGNAGGHSFFSDDKGVERGEDMVKVKTVSLEDFMKENDIFKIDFLKIDCEGAEYEILFGCPKEIFEKIGKISMEYHDIDGNRNSAKLKEFLESQGFAVSISSGIFPMLYASK